MRSWLAAGLATLLVAGSALSAGAATSTKRYASGTGTSFEVQGTVVEVSKGWFELSVDRVLRGPVARGTRIRVGEPASVRFLRGGKPVSAAELKRGSVVRVVGTWRGSGKQAAYTATRVTVLK
ncbi:MAG: hypothetical protein QN148_10565 [Armatimonadota bacterium]|nr:hypothetical protein [Armatimonadota bacterium]MDR7566209.1 hypothetical protein [Armatimonadota bacterium]MDR7581744.1 hypothetical protein [Armatimonadota bacterium]MDR7595510.1 hypothetical protein [Armatimonadota bacterium]